MTKKVVVPLFIFCITLVGCQQEEQAAIKQLDLAAITPQAGGNNGNSDITQSRTNAITRAVENASEAVCGINVIQIREYRSNPFFDDPAFRHFFRDNIIRRQVKNLGSGFLISPDGFILTNEHVVHNAAQIIVALPDGSTREAELVGSDYITDVALIKIEGSGYPHLRLGDSEDIIIGEWVIALGNPFGLFEINSKPTVTVGVISAIDRDFGKNNESRVYQDMIQTDAAINRGNSGGPLVNSLGEVIGMNAFIYTDDYSTGSIGLGFAIPSNRIQKVLRDLKKYGKVDRSWRTGLVVQEITPWLADYFRLESTQGTIITEVERNSSAERAGLRVRDIILEVNGQKIRNENDIYDVIDINDLRAGDVLELKVLREQKVLNIKLQLERVR